MEWNMQQVRELLEEILSKELYQIIISNAKDKEKMSKVKVRPVLVKDELLFQETIYIGTQVFHGNYEKNEILERIVGYLEENFRQCEIETQQLKATVLISKKGKVTLKRKGKIGKTADLSHNRTKSYIMEEGKVVPFLVDLGVQTKEGKIVKARYDKFKQINRFLEFIEDILPTLPKGEKINIIDFGCGKSYLTFAIYYYLKVLQGLDVQITGLDLKKDVICHCNELAVKYGYDNLHFLHGDISTYAEENGENKIDMVVTLHACDTATDYALAKAVGWNAQVILSVPCCQHEVNKQIECEELGSALKYGMLKERMSALFTDAIRANLLEENGYDVQLMEFIDMEHTPKNILIRAVKKTDGGKRKDATSKRLADFLGVETTLQKLLQ